MPSRANPDPKASAYLRVPQPQVERQPAWPCQLLALITAACADLLSRGVEL